MKNIRMCITMDDDLKEVFDETKGLAKNSTYANYIMRSWFASQGLISEVPANVPG